MSLVKIENFNEQLELIRMKLPEYLNSKGYDITNGRKIRCINPDHDDRHPSMSSFTTKEGHEVVKCFSCGFSADIFKCAHVIEHKPMMGPGFIEDNVLYLAKLFDIDIQTKALTEEEIYEMSTYEAYRVTADYISQAPFSEAIQAELGRREWSEEFVRSRNVGTCDDFQKMRGLLKMYGFTAKFLDEIDLGNQRIFDPSNLIFTVHDDYGRPVGFAARNLNFDGVRDDNGRLVNGAKFNNTKTTGVKCNIYRKSERLYLLHEAKKKSPPLYIFEGYGDCLTLQRAGLINSTAIGSLELSEHHFNTCRRNGIYDVVICLDADEAGQKKARILLDEVLQNVHDIKVRFIFIPEVRDEEGNMVKVDPDEYVRGQGLESFLSLPKINPFEWRLSEFEKEDDFDPESVCFSMIPIIQGEPSAIKREGMIKELSEFTGYSYKVIKEELEKLTDSEEAKIQLKRQAVVDGIINALQGRKESVDILLQRGMDDLYNIEKEHNAGSLDPTTLVNNMLAIKQYEENEELHNPLNMGSNFRTLSAALAGDLRGKMILLGGTANTGKTTKFANLAMNLAMFNDDVISVMVTLDDSAKEFVPRLVTYDMARRAWESRSDLFDLITINKVAQPFLFKNEIEYDAIMEERETSYATVLKLTREEKLVVLDSENGKSIDYLNSVLKTLTDRYPEKRVIMFVDNFHHIDCPGQEEGRNKYKALSRGLKQLCVTYDATAIATVEYTKIPKGQKPGNQNLAETVALEYDANAIIHLYSELHDMREQSLKYFYNHEGEERPIIEEDFGKNKVNSFKGTVLYKFHPDKAFYQEITRQQLLELESSNAHDREAQRISADEEEASRNSPALSRFGENERPM